MIRSAIFAAFFALLLPGCSRSSAPAAADEFLTTWLVRGDIAASKRRLPEDYDRRSPGDLSSWPAPLRNLSRSERALRFPLTTCARCSSLTNCIQAKVRSDAAYDLDTVVIGDEQVAQIPELEHYRGRSMNIVTFLMKQCPLAAIVVFDPEAGEGHSVAAIAFLSSGE